ncbi:MarR family winged helix-turn-helix transcriptional regulator [Herbiconiux sp. KACC 21604]|uniref:MarR family winged helix-turn-helix transcriptional regulator n=1 Tax=unclassified Herbiconiux TaxID=2618217 RepID=UPI001492697A|nr:MarR family winged helix-turn-helix transcriptional regulator [Herbiconiux sp. SALV-R1]QJU55297.1 winged helix-turn-helix transcriptional regulator [Herbiconiux sp. SALV-R1]WPO86464.1 MarR family winged helix-turn-helix transcriptional regulator [Herbiconiux sp. KACC 21604]
MNDTDLTTAQGFRSTPLRSFFGYVLGCTLQLHTALWTEAIGTEPTSPQFAVLEALAAKPGSDQRKVGELAYLDKSSTMDIVRRLTRNQWISRERSALDTRRDVLTLTAAARFALDQLRPAAQRVQNELLSPLEEPEHEPFLADLTAVGRADLDSTRAWTSQLPGVLVRRARQVHTALIGEFVGNGITGPQLSAMITLTRSPGINQRVLGEIAALDKSTAADIVSRLDKRGWLHRYRDPADGRRQVLELTDAGAEAARDLAPRVRQAQEGALEPLDPPRRERFLDALTRLARVGDL